MVRVMRAHKRPFLYMMAAALTLSVLGTACGGDGEAGSVPTIAAPVSTESPPPASGQPKRGGTLRVAVVKAHTTFDPHIVNDNPDIQLTRHAYDNLILLDPDDLSLIPNPPKDTDGRREESGRGGEGATGEIAWVPFGVGRSADGLHRRTGAPMAVCGSCDARDGERIRSRELSRTGLARVCGDLRLSGGWVADGAVRPGVEWLAAGPRRG